MAFFSFFGKHNCLCKNLSSFNCNLHLKMPDGMVLSVRWSETIQYRQRVLFIPLSGILNSPMCPAQALLLSLRLSNSPPDGPLFSFSSGTGWLPLTTRRIDDRLKVLLHRLNLHPSLYSGHSFRRGGATFALECGITSKLIKAQGDWATLCYERYITPSLSLRKTLADKLDKCVGSV